VRDCLRALLTLKVENKIIITITITTVAIEIKTVAGKRIRPLHTDTVIL
jgi:hypothetical protein